MSEKELSIIGLIAYAAGLIKVDLALGAICGTVFFMLMPAIFEHWIKQAALVFISLIGGYLAGLAAGDHGGWVSFVAAALLVTLLFAVIKLINNARANEFLRLVIDAIRELRQR